MRNHTLAYAAKLLGTGRNRLIADLKKRQILDHQRLPAQKLIDAGLFVTELRQHTGNQEWNNGNGQLYSIALVTPKGLQWLAGQLGITVKNMDAPPAQQQADDAKALEQARSAIRLMQMHINCPTAIDSATALAVADEALQLLERRCAA